MTKLERIDIIGQNGNDGLHYKEELVIKPYEPSTEEEKPSEQQQVESAPSTAVEEGAMHAFAKYSGEYIFKRFKEERDAKLWAKQSGFIYDGAVSEEFFKRIMERARVSYSGGRGD